MAASKEYCARNYRRLTLVVACLVLVTNGLTTSYFWGLGDDPFDIAEHLSIYGGFATVLSFLGIVGAAKNNSTLVTIFANFLILDVVISIVPRVLAFTLFPELEGFVCSPDSVNAWIQRQPAFASVSREEAFVQLTVQCHNVLSVLQIVLATFVASITFVQCWLALRIYRFARHLRLEELGVARWAIRLEDGKRGDEKSGLLL